MEHIDLKAFREAKNLTQTQLADILGCKQTFISAIEKGERLLPDEKYAILLDKYSDITAYTSRGDTVIQQTKKGDNINGQTVKVTKDSSEKFLEVILKQADQLSVSQAQISKSQEQIDRLITLIENKQ